MRSRLVRVAALALAVCAFGVIATPAGAEEGDDRLAYVGTSFVSDSGLVSQCNRCFPGLPSHGGLWSGG